MAKLTDANSSILPLTTDDILGDQLTPMTPQIDRLSSIGSINSSQSRLPSLSTYSYAQRQSHRSRIRKIRDNLNSRFQIPKYFKRIFVFNSLDFETAFWEIMNLIKNPKRVYKSSYYQKQTKNRWARDDPSFVLILCFFLTISAIFWGLMYSPGAIGILKLILYMVIVDFLLFGLIISTVGWILANKIFLLPDAQPTNPIASSTTTNGLNFDSSILSSIPLVNKLLIRNSILEWSYCFDVHCNAYLIIWISLYLVQFFLIPLVRLNNIFATLVGNTLYLIALSYYSVITFYGYNALPFLHRTELLLSPIAVFSLVWLILTITGVNFANIMINAYFN